MFGLGLSKEKYVFFHKKAIKNLPSVIVMIIAKFVAVGLDESFSSLVETFAPW